MFEAKVRFRTIGDATCTGCVESTAYGIDAVVAEVAASRLTERGATRADDRVSEAGWRTGRRRATSDVRASPASDRRKC